MACPSEFMPGKLTQQQVELRCGYYTKQCLQQLEQSPELAKLKELKKQERLAQHARHTKVAIFLSLLALLVLVCAYSGTHKPLQVHSFRLISAGWCCCYFVWSFCKASHSCQTPEKHPLAKHDPVCALHYFDSSSVPQAKYYQSQLGNFKTAFTVEHQHFADSNVAVHPSDHITR